MINPLFFFLLLFPAFSFASTYPATFHMSYRLVFGSQTYDGTPQEICDNRPFAMSPTYFPYSEQVGGAYQCTVVYANSGNPSGVIPIIEVVTYSCVAPDLLITGSDQCQVFEASSLPAPVTVYSPGVYSTHNIGGVDRSGDSPSSVCSDAVIPSSLYSFIAISSVSCNLYLKSDGSFANSFPIDFSAPTVLCPDGSTASSLADCPVQCTLPQVLDNATGVCLIPVKPDCVIPQNPVTVDCKYPDDKGLPVDCFDGSTVYVPMTCPLNAWDQFLHDLTNFPKLTQCVDGQSKQSCIDAKMQQIGVNKLSDMIGAVILQGKPTLRASGFLNDGVPNVRAVYDLSTTIGLGTLKYFRVEAEVPTISLAKALTEYIKSVPTGSYPVALAAAVAAGAAGTVITIDSNTGIFTPSGSTVPLSPNQVFDIANDVSGSVPLPLTEMSPYIQPESIPWLAPGLDAIEGDFQRILDPQINLEPIHFPTVKNGLQTSPIPYASPDPQPIATLSPGSPMYYPQPHPVKTLSPGNPVSPSMIPSPTVSVPTPLPVNPQGTPPIDVGTLPKPPTLEPDYPLYFDFLPMGNPFDFEPSDFMPNLPASGVCSYEIHRTFHVPFLGDKDLDLAPCVPLQPLRDVLNWAFAVLSLLTCFNIIFRSSF